MRNFINLARFIQVHNIICVSFFTWKWQKQEHIQQQIFRLHNLNLKWQPFQITYQAYYVCSTVCNLLLNQTIAKFYLFLAKNAKTNMEEGERESRSNRKLHENSKTQAAFFGIQM